MEHHEYEFEKAAREDRALAIEDNLAAIKHGKALLEKKGRTSGRFRCIRPGCGGKVSIALVGPKGHLRMACDNPECNVRAMS